MRAQPDLAWQSYAGALLAEATPARTGAIVGLMAELTGGQRARLSRLCRRLLRVLDPYEEEEADTVSTDDAPAVPALADVTSESAGDADVPNVTRSRAVHSSNLTFIHDAGTALPTNTGPDTGS